MPLTFASHRSPAAGVVRTFWIEDRLSASLSAASGGGLADQLMEAGSVAGEARLLADAEKPLSQEEEPPSASATSAQSAGERPASARLPPRPPSQHAAHKLAKTGSGNELQLHQPQQQQQQQQQHPPTSSLSPAAAAARYSSVARLLRGVQPPRALARALGRAVAGSGVGNESSRASQASALSAASSFNSREATARDVIGRGARSSRDEARPAAHFAERPGGSKSERHAASVAPFLEDGGRRLASSEASRGPPAPQPPIIPTAANASEAGGGGYKRPPDPKFSAYTPPWELPLRLPPIEEVPQVPPSAAASPNTIRSRRSLERTSVEGQDLTGPWRPPLRESPADEGEEPSMPSLAHTRRLQRPPPAGLIEHLAKAPPQQHWPGLASSAAETGDSGGGDEVETLLRQQAEFVSALSSAARATLMSTAVILLVGMQRSRSSTCGPLLRASCVLRTRPLPHTPVHSRLYHPSPGRRADGSAPALSRGRLVAVRAGGRRGACGGRRWRRGGNSRRQLGAGAGRHAHGKGRWPVPVLPLRCTHAVGHVPAELVVDV